MRTLLICTIILAAQVSLAEGTNRIDRRQQHQSQRIENGSAQLSEVEANKLQRGQNRIQAAEQRALADGNLQAREKYRIEKMQDRQSRKIKRFKHNNPKSVQ